MSETTVHAAHQSDHDHALELRKEAYTMALYVAICLLAALAAVPESSTDEHAHAFAIIWGTTIGLALAHWFAFQVSARLVASGSVRAHDAAAAGAQLVGAAVVGVIATVPVVLFPDSVEFDVARIVLACFVAFVGYGVARGGGASRIRSLMYGSSILVVALLVATTKNLLVGH
jgi:hypothetical protein